MAVGYTEKQVIPDLLSLDYNTFKNRQISILRNTEEFKDYNFEGSNISVILERHAYEVELNTFYVNKIAKNLYEDTVDLYENAHRISRMKGYNAKGYNSSSTNLIINVTQTDNNSLTKVWSPNDILHIPAFGEVAPEIDPTIVFYIDKTYEFKVPSEEELNYGSESNFSMTVGIRQGKKREYVFTGKDVIDNIIVLPFVNYDYGTNGDSSVYLTIDGEPWIRVDDFFDGISGVKRYFDTNNVFALYYDKYKRYTIEFSSLRNTPTNLSEIRVVLFESVGETGNVGKNTITNLVTSDLVYNQTKGIYIPKDLIKITNPIPAVGGTNDQSINDVSLGGKANMHMQYRTVIGRDYKDFIKARADVDAAYVYGENEIAPKGDVRLYNKVFISVIPSSWNMGTINSETSVWTPIDFPRNVDIIKPLSYAEKFKDSILLDLEQRKWINSYEEFVLPKLVYFSFVIGVKVKRLYNYVEVCNDIRDKILFYFDEENREFHEKISFMDLHNFVLDTSSRTQIKDWTNIQGIENLVFRDVQVNAPFYEDKKNVYPPNKENLYPQYTREEFLSSYENKMKIIYLGFDQFPIINKDLILFVQEV